MEKRYNQLFPIDIVKIKNYIFFYFYYILELSLCAALLLEYYKKRLTNTISFTYNPVKINNNSN